MYGLTVSGLFMQETSTFGKWERDTLCHFSLLLGLGMGEVAAVLTL